MKFFGNKEKRTFYKNKAGTKQKCTTALRIRYNNRRRSINIKLEYFSNGHITKTHFRKVEKSYQCQFLYSGWDARLKLSHWVLSRLRGLLNMSYWVSCVVIGWEVGCLRYSSWETVFSCSLYYYFIPIKKSIYNAKL